MKPRALIPWWQGTNCHHETKHACERAGARAEIVLMSQLVGGQRKLYEADLVVLAGGFSLGDYGWGAGCGAAIDLVYRLGDQLQEARSRRIPMIGFCNGAQILAATGLVPGQGTIGHPTVIFDVNSGGQFEHWVETRVFLHEPQGAGNVWTKGLEGRMVRMTAAHREGRLVCADGTAAHTPIIGTYGNPEGESTYPRSPSGSPIAGIGSIDSLIAVFMPHVERMPYDDGIEIIRCGVRAVQ